jgi:hypothetical protein
MDDAKTERKFPLFLFATSASLGPFKAVADMDVRVGASRDGFTASLEGPRGADVAS